MEECKAKPADLVGLIAYQEGSIVSKQVLKKESGNVTLFAFDRGEELTEHTSVFDALLQVIEGEAEVTVSGKTSAVKAGQIIFMPAKEPHAVKAVARFKMLLTLLR